MKFIESQTIAEENQKAIEYSIALREEQSRLQNLMKAKCRDLLSLMKRNEPKIQQNEKP